MAKQKERRDEKAIQGRMDKTLLKMLKTPHKPRKREKTPPK